MARREKMLSELPSPPRDGPFSAQKRVIRRGIYLLLHPVALLLFAGLLILVSGRYRPLSGELIDPLGFLFGIMGGLLFYYGALALVGQELYGVRTYLRGLDRSLNQFRPPTRRLAALGARALYEEAFWRGTVQVLLGNGAVGLLLTATGFTLRHVYLYRRRQPLGTLVLVEFFLFSLLLGAVYLVSGRIMVVIGLHFIRNVLTTAGCWLPGAQTQAVHRQPDHI